MEFIFDKNTLHNFGEAIKHEWLETNGLGGWASSTIIGANTRKYHGLLVAATHPPVGRMVLISKIDETISYKKERTPLGCNQYPGAIAPFGHINLESFKKGIFPEYTYKAGEIVLKKTVFAVQGENTTVVIYEALKSPAAFDLELTPMIAGRDYHSLSHINQYFDEDTEFRNSVFSIKPYTDCPTIYISVPGSDYDIRPDWYYNFEYEYERNRGLEYHEDIYTPGRLTVKLSEGQKIGIILSTDHPKDKDPFELYQIEETRRKKLIIPGFDDFASTLTLAADQFIVKRGEKLKTVIAGYHWFSDWGRDTMISLPGLCLVTQRFDDAKNILRAFAQSVSQGMLPNRFPDHGETPEYNTVDATLWFFIAIYKYFNYSKDVSFIRLEMMPVLKEIIDWHVKGTRYGIRAEESGLLTAGEHGSQLTWMDAKVGDWVVTPRQGKAVEINALWYNALIIYTQFLKEFDNVTTAQEYGWMAEHVHKNFNEIFWNEDKECLYDYIDGDYKDEAIRPNQVFALSLPFPLITGMKAQKILKVIEEKLYTPVGLRSLSKEHKDYRSVYEGDVWSRDGAYHQGTVWSWLMGPYIDALMEVRGATGKKQAKEAIQNFKYHLREEGLGTVSEIFDGKYPHSPKGCIAQAWGVAEILRVYIEYKLSEENN